MFFGSLFGLVLPQLEDERNLVTIPDCIYINYHFLANTRTGPRWNNTDEEIRMYEWRSEKTRPTFVVLLEVQCPFVNSSLFATITSTSDATYSLPEAYDFVDSRLPIINAIISLYHDQRDVTYQSLFYEDRGRRSGFESGVALLVIASIVIIGVILVIVCWFIKVVLTRIQLRRLEKAREAHEAQEAARQAKMEEETTKTSTHESESSSSSSLATLPPPEARKMTKEEVAAAIAAENADSDDDGDDYVAVSK